MKVDEFNLIKRIGEGAFGEVYLTKKEKDYNCYATKKIKKAYVLQNNLERYLNNEMRIIKSIKHENIIKFITLKETMNHYYMIFEFCNGGTLTKFMSDYKAIHNMPLEDSLVQSIFKQITAGIRYLHSKNILHRDLKPDNILLDSKSIDNRSDLSNIEIKIIDFGFARYLKDDEIAMSTLGSPLHMDPRIFKKMKKIEDFKFYGYKKDADIWSLGCILYEMLIGIPPFPAESYEELLDKLNKGIYNIPTKLKISREAISLVNGMLQDNPLTRLTIEEVFNHPFLNKDHKKFDYLDLKKKIKPNLLSKSQRYIMLSTESKDIWSLFIDEKAENINLSLIITPHEEPNEEEKVTSEMKELTINEKKESKELKLIEENLQEKIDNIDSLDFSKHSELEMSINILYDMISKEEYNEGDNIFPIFPYREV